ncbi:MAG: hypothetical protein IPP73_16365 [Chitinophagaceae bacterium]|nr:hypothetical protein [Chitinophagaceae bacterium]
MTFLLNDIQYCYGDNGTIRIGNPPYGISVTVDAQFQNALVEYRECNNGVQARLSKTNNGWVVIDSHITWIY